MNSKYDIFLILIFVRILDLYTTKLAVIDFTAQEQNVIVKVFNLNMLTFYIFEIVLTFLLGFCYLYYLKNLSLFEIQKRKFIDYTKSFFYSDQKLSILDLFFKIKIRNIFAILGAIIPVYIITTSILFCLNNLWVYLYIQNNEIAIKYYNLLAGLYFFDFIIFIFPVVFFFYLIYKKLYTEFLFYSKLN